MAILSLFVVAGSRTEFIFRTFGASLEAEIIARAVIDTVQVSKVASIDLIRVLDCIKPLDATVKGVVTTINAGNAFGGAVAVEIVSELKSRPANCFL